LALPILVLGEFVGHALAYRLVAPDARERAALLARTGHDYLSYLHPLVGVLVALAAFALVGRVRASFRSGICGRGPSWRFAGLLPVAFVCQEYVERLAHAGRPEWTTVAEPAVLVGIVVQVPCGVAALWLIRLLLRLAFSAGRALAARERRERIRPTVVMRPAGVDLVRPLLFARGIPPRGPPQLA
jgi:hypothetical protein